MISHRYKCIFVHIPRTGGTSIEEWITGYDWWHVKKNAKHLVASQAKQLYNEYWDGYFKFSFIRNPVSRMISCLKYPGHFGLSVLDGAISFTKYHELFGDKIVLEHDHRFYKRDEIINSNHKEMCVYSNILDEKIDFVGKIETLEQDIKIIAKELNITKIFSFHSESFTDAKRIVYDNNFIRHIKKIFSHDILQFKYDVDQFLSLEE